MYEILNLWGNSQESLIKVWLLKIIIVNLHKISINHEFTLKSRQADHC